MFWLKRGVKKSSAFFTQKCPRRKFVLPRRIGHRGKICATLLRQALLPEVLSPEICLATSYRPYRGKKRHFVTAGFASRSARAGNLSCHVGQDLLGRKAPLCYGRFLPEVLSPEMCLATSYRAYSTLLRQVMLPEVLAPEICHAMSYKIFWAEKRHFVTAQVFLPEVPSEVPSPEICLATSYEPTGKTCATLLRQALLPEVLSPEICLATSYRPYRGKKRHFATAGFASRCARAGNLSCHVVQDLLGRKAPLCYGAGFLPGVLAPDTCLATSYRAYRGK